MQNMQPSGEVTMARNEEALKKFRQIAHLMRDIGDAGFQLYVAGSGRLYLMRGPSHDDAGEPMRDNIVASDGVPCISGGDW